MNENKKSWLRDGRTFDVYAVVSILVGFTAWLLHTKEIFLISQVK